MSAIRCKVCDAGSMVRRKRRRLSGPAVFVGYVFLIPAMLGFALGLFLIVSGTGAAASLDTARQEQRSKLVAAGVPDAYVQRIMAGDHVAPAEYGRLPSAPRKAIIDAQGRVAFQALGGIAGAGVGIAILIASAVVGLLGWLLTMKKLVLQCNHCAAVVNAS